MEFSPVPGYTYGTRDICGCMGIINSRHFSLEDMQENELDISILRENLLKIAAHYGTEPPQVNFTTLTSFFNPFINKEMEGAVLGFDILKPEFPLLSTISYCDREIPVYDLSPILDVTRLYLEKFPFYPGCHVFEATTEYSSFMYADNKGDSDHIQIYSGIAVGIPERGCRLLMEDRGYITRKDEKDKIVQSLAHSILLCERIENITCKAVKYKEIYVHVDVSEPLQKDEQYTFQFGKGFIPTWTQTQFMYALPPREFVPAGRNFDDLRDTTFEEWLRQIG
jgi:hypothetical protein